MKTASDALKVIKAIAEAKKNGTSRPDVELAAEVAKALKLIEAEGIKIPGRNSDPVFKTRWGTPERNIGPRGAYKYAIRKAAGEDKWLKKFHDWNDDVLLASMALKQDVRTVLKNVPDFGEFWEKDLAKGEGELAKAMAAATTGSGAEWIPEVFSPELVDMIRVERVLAQAFRRFPMTASTVNLSTLIQDFVAYGIDESTGNTPYSVPAVVSDLGTGDAILTAVEVIVASIFSKTFEEDSIIPALPEIRRRLVEGMSEGEENAILNGSTESTHPDSDVAAAAGGVSDVQSIWDGLRADAMGTDMTTTSGTVDLGAGNMTADNVLKLRLLQGRFGTKPSDSIWVTSPQGLVKLMGLRDANGNQVLLTLDKIGQAATLLRGALGQLYGSDIVVSDLVKTTLDANGVVPATPGTLTQLLLAHKNAFIIGDRRMLDVEMDQAPLTRQRIMVATIREIFKRIKPAQSALDRAVTAGLNIATT